MRRRRAVVVFICSAAALVLLGVAISTSIQAEFERRASNTHTAMQQEAPSSEERYDRARQELQALEVKGRAPKTGYTRAQFGNGWAKIQGCSTRDIILHRDLSNVTLNDECKVMAGVLNDPYTGNTLQFTREKSAAVQIDHVVALSNAWQTGAQQLTLDQRIKLANDPLELLAVDGAANQQKGDGDAATWLPSNKAFRCEYVARQIQVKRKYALWVTDAEKSAMIAVLSRC